MPHGNKRSKGRQTNKKKKGKGAGGGSAFASSSSSSGQQHLQGQIPSIWQDFSHISTTDNIHDPKTFRSLYGRYKAATRRFWNYIQDNTPDHVVRRHNNNTKEFAVNDLVSAAEWMQETNHEMPLSVMIDLKVAIQARSRVALSVFGGGDRGHQHFLKVLAFCWTRLANLPRIHSSKKKKKPVVETEEEEETMEVLEMHHFEALWYDEEEDISMEENDDYLPTGTVPRPDVNETTSSLTLEELMRADDRNDVVLFLLTINEIMASVAEQYRNVARQQQALWDMPSALVETYLEAAVAANMAIQQVQTLELELMFQHKHLTTPYRALATLVFPEIVQHLATTLRDHADNPHWSEKDIYIFLGDTLECHFRNSSDPASRKDTLVPEFCAAFRVDAVGSTEIEQMFAAVQQLVVVEVPISSEATMNRSHMEGLFNAAAREAGETVALPQSHSWLQKMPYIEGDRSILHTLRLVQSFGDVIASTPQDRGITAARSGLFGPSWRPGIQVRKIHTDMDELLMTKILPEWVIMCRKGILSQQKLPREDELCPLFVSIRKYVQNPDRPVSWSLAFCVHAMLTSIFETQGGWKHLTNITKRTFNNYFEQLAWARKLTTNEESSGCGNSQLWQRNMLSVAFLDNLALPVFGDPAIWNPLYGGTALSYVCFFGNVEGGCAMIDCLGQLRIVLYLYHGLLIRGIVRRGRMPMLDILYDGFKTCKGVWEGPLPQRGELVKRWWLCFGAGIAEAQSLAEASRMATVQRRLVNEDDSTTRYQRRQMTPIEPSEISKAFRRICNRDFSDVVDRYHTPEQRQRNKDTDHYRFAVRMNDTLDAMEGEQKMLALNLVNCSVLLDQFVISLARILQWEPLLSLGTIDGNDSSRTKRDTLVLLFAQHLLGALDFADDPYHFSFLDVPLGEASSTFLTTFFSRLSPDRMLWFTPVEQED